MVSSHLKTRSATGLLLAAVLMSFSGPAGAGQEFETNTTIQACGKWVFKIKDYGKDKMEQYRRSADRVGEPRPSFRLFPDKVQESPPLRAAVQLGMALGDLQSIRFGEVHTAQQVLEARVFADGVEKR